ncbi:hypothetical protein EDB81DRAFT_634016 [Dactylonectria macrodidyma]|uniref:Uncharacterized protein n=1 Tax=Dactylonectria macrodidyma TaxID=307937 RepID=A0A9P9FS59_9HYPO|nr:hypothetical protein EDB81DRAFT_634016 [Dactylonectria macrodidyma]
MIIITVANMRRRVLLHKVILLELLLAMSHGTFCFMSFDGYGFYLSSTAALLYCSYFTHNVVAWMKIKPFFTGPRPSFGPRYCDWVRWTYLTTLAMTIPALIFQIFNNFRYFNNYSTLYQTVRPYEPLMRDPWWIFSCFTLFHVIRKSYSLNFFKLVGPSPRFLIMLAAIFLAITFTIMDMLSSVISGLSGTDGINPYWKLALVFKCLTDNILLDDFKSVLQRLFDLNADQTTTMLLDWMDTNLSEQPSSANHCEEAFGEPSSQRTRNKPWDHSDTGPEHSQLPDDYENRHRPRGMSANVVGKLGIKVHKLPMLPF